MAEQAQAFELEFDRSVLGVEVEVAKVTVTEEYIRQFNAAVGETNPLFNDAEFARAQGYRGLVAPPTLYSTISEGGRGGLDPKVKFGTTGFNAGQHSTFGAAIIAGDTITAKNQVADVYAKTGRTGTMVFVVRKTTFVNQLGQMVAEVEQSSVLRDMGVNRGS